MKGQEEVARDLRPDPPTTNTLWLIVVSAFAAILVGAVLTLALLTLGIYRNVAGAGGPDTKTILIVFTTAAGFLRGLLTPTPIRQSGGQG